MAYLNNIQNLAADSVWNQSVDLLKDKLDPQIFAAWIKPLEITSLEVSSNNKEHNSPFGEVELAAPNKFCLEHVQKNYEDLISTALKGVLGTESAVVRFKVRPQLNTKTSPVIIPAANTSEPSSTAKIAGDVLEKTEKMSKAALRSPIERARRARGVDSANLNPKYNFSNFVIGLCNQFPHAASLRVAEAPGAAYNPLFLYGGVGLGKTHLVNAIGNACRRRGKKVLLVSSEIFVNELIASLRSNRMDQFKSKFRSLDVLIIDDIQFIIGKERTQEEFFHTFNDLHQRHKQIIVTSDKVPQELTGLEERLRTRFASGLSADLQPPDFETRVAILNKKAELSSISLPEDVARFLAEEVDTNVRELEGALNRIQAISSIHQSPISLSLAQNALENFIPEKNREITTELIQKTVAEKYKVSLADILGKRRTQNIAFARHIAMYLCRTLTPCSYPEIGAFFGGRDHSTVIHAFRVVEKKLAEKPNVESDIEELKKTLGVN